MHKHPLNKKVITIPYNKEETMNFLENHGFKHPEAKYGEVFVMNIQSRNELKNLPPWIKYIRVGYRAFYNGNVIEHCRPVFTNLFHLRNDEDEM